MSAGTPERGDSPPPHVAIIMDGNGRWAQAQGLERIEGHKAGANTVRKVVEECRRLGVKHLTLFSFSTENWQRSKDEVRGLMKLFRQYLDSELNSLLENGIRLRAIGDLERLPFPVRSALRRNMEATKDNSDMSLVLAISYGGREEILHAAKKISQKVADGKLSPDVITAEEFSKALWSKDIPDPDLLIRTSGEMRISNFLLWQLAYSEIVVTPEHWPEFSEETLRCCFEQYASRERRFGLTTEQIADMRLGG